MANGWDILGHDWAVNLLRGQIQRDRLSHAYLLTGPEGVGRRRLALSLAKAVNCQNPPAPGEFCNECRACRGFAKMAHPDLHIVQREEGDRDIKVDAVRELTRMLALTPYEAEYQIALLLNFERASAGAANALLKTLEEPPRNVLLVLTAESAESLPATIASRCELLALRPMPIERLAVGLMEQQQMDEARAQLLARVSAGRPEYALSLNEDAELLAQREVWLGELARLLELGRVERFVFAEQFKHDRDGLRQALIVWLSYWRDLLLRRSEAKSPLSNLDHEAEISALADKLSLEEARGALASIEETLYSLSGNSNARLAIESLLLKLPRVSLN